MIKKALCFTFGLLLLIFGLSPKVFAATNNYISIVNPVRGDEFWNLKDQKVETAVLGEERILDSYSAPATWLLRFDALDNSVITNSLKNRKNDELGILLEITPKLTTASEVSYHKSPSWHSAGSVFLTGYNPADRIKLIDTVFGKFKGQFGYYPKSVGAWWIDSYSLQYMQEKYGITSAMIVADQYSTDNYQIWGQYWGTPYYPAKNNNLIPAQDVQSKVPVVITQWATRDPVNGYGNGVAESTYSLQPNDYMDYHNLTTSYFEKLVDLYMKQPFNKFNQLTVGLENSYTWDKYKGEYGNQIKALVDRQKGGELNLSTMNGFAQFYMSAFPATSPAQIIIANDPLGTDKKAVWYMDNYYRAGWFYDSNGSNFRDIRQYIDGSPEICLDKACDSLNFATSATRVLDDVSFNQRWELDPGRITHFQVKKDGDNYQLTYDNEAGKNESITFLPRDLSFNGKISTIDGAILDAVKSSLSSVKSLYPIDANGGLKSSIFGQLVSLLKFAFFLIFAITIPGELILKKAQVEKESDIFLGISIGIVSLTLFSYLLGFFKLWGVLYAYIFVSFILFMKSGVLSTIHFPKIKKWTLFLILAGSIFQLLPTIKSGLLYDFGIGYWGPNSHDGIWHIALANQILQGIFPQNPAFSGAVLKNYHYFYDLLLAVTSYTVKVSIPDLLFRFYPLLFSLLIGFGSFGLVKKLFKSETAAAISLYFIYFAGSLGWIVEFLKEHHLGGESAFWANQSISLNLNPPFAISLILLLAVFEIVILFEQKKEAWLGGIFILLSGTLIEFKSYAGILALTSFGILALYQLIKERKSFYLVNIFISGLLSLIIFIPNVTFKQFFIFSPFWLIHTMVDFPDRVGWVRLSTARTAYIARGNWPKFFLVEIIGFILFVGGNLGMRILGVLPAMKAKIDFKGFKVFISSFLVLSLVIPLLFIQAGTNWNIVQFFYYFMFIIALFSGVGVEWIYKRTPKIWGLLLILIVVILAPINSVSTASSYFGSPRPHAFIGNGEYKALNFLSKEPQGNILTYPYDQKLRDLVSDPRPLFAYDSTAYVSAYSAHPVFVEDYGQNDILQTPYLERVVASKDFFSGSDIDSERKFLNENKISYIYLPRYFSFPLDEQLLGVKKIFENSDVVIYGVNY